MQHMHEEIRIEAPIEDVWELFCDTSHWKELMPRNEFSDISGPVDKVGTTYVTSMRVMGFEMKETMEIVEVEPLKLIHEHTDHGPMDNYFRFEPDGDATRVVLVSDFEMPGKLPGFVGGLVVKGFSERYTRHVLADLKALAEAKVPAHA
jgi:carbon monoxide dehydrogenase subunit G